jgi:two-component system sensor histidine kinase TctE
MVQVSGHLPTVMGNRSLLAEVVQNLVENAIKYGGKPVPRVRIVGGQVGDRAFVEVEDDGPGVPEEARSRVFASFEQLNPGASGVGAGLALVRRLVEAHDGSVEITDGQVLGGACFRVCLPAILLQHRQHAQHG